MPSLRKRVLLSLLAVFLVLASLLRPFDRMSEEYLDDALRNALVTFALARVLNAGISVAQATELSFSPAGIGVTLLPGEVLDPLNDLVERFSWVMLVAASSLGIQKLLLSISASLGFTLLMAAALALYLALLWLGAGGRWRRAAFALAAVLVSLRFAMGLASLGNELVYRQFLAEDYETATAGLERASGRIEALGLEEKAAEEPRGFWDRAERYNPTRHLQALKQAAGEAVDHLIRLIVVFVLQTLLLPLLLLWGLYKAVGALIRVGTETGRAEKR